MIFRNARDDILDAKDSVVYLMNRARGTHLADILDDVDRRLDDALNWVEDQIEAERQAEQE